MSIRRFALAALASALIAGPPASFTVMTCDNLPDNGRLVRVQGDGAEPPGVAEPVDEPVGEHAVRALVLEDPPAPALFHDLRASPDAEDELRRIVSAEAGAPFDLRTGPLVRATLVRRRPAHHDPRWHPCRSAAG